MTPSRGSKLILPAVAISTCLLSSAFGQHGLWGNSSWAKPHPVYKEHMQIPLIIRQPALVPPGTSTDRIISQYDFFPTLLELVGLQNKTIENSPGESFGPVLRGDRQSRSDKACFEYITARAVVTEDWKFVKRLFGEPTELYHLKSDPEENHNLFGRPEHAEDAALLDEEIDEFFAKHANIEFAPWRGGTGKAILMYTDKNDRFEAAFPNWREPYVERLVPFSDM